MYINGGIIGYNKVPFTIKKYSRGLSNKIIDKNKFVGPRLIKSRYCVQNQEVLRYLFELDGNLLDYYFGYEVLLCNGVMCVKTSKQDIYSLLLLPCAILCLITPDKHHKLATRIKLFLCYHWSSRWLLTCLSLSFPSLAAIAFSNL